MFGDLAAEKAAAYIRTVDDYDITTLPIIQEKIHLYQHLMRVEPGANWKEANTTLQKIMEEYVGTKVRSESLLTAGRKYICDLCGYAEEKLQADNSHELMRCLEVLDLLDLAEACAVSALERKESRGAYHRRSDYPFTNPLLNNKFQTITLSEQGLTTEFRNRIK